MFLAVDMLEDERARVFMAADSGVIGSAHLFNCLSV